MVAQAERVEWVVVGTEVDALILEHSLIQAHKPRFNVRLKDDKSYPWLAVTVNEEWPRPVVFRGRKRKGVRYFGPYGHVGALRETLDLLLRSFPIRTCSDAKFKRHAAARPALPPLRHRAVLGPVRRRGRAASATPRWSRTSCGSSPGRPRPVRRPAARPRWRRPPTRSSSSGRRGCATGWSPCARRPRPSRWCPTAPEDLDLIGVAEDELEAAVQVFHVRRGRVVGRSGSIADKVEDLTPEQFVGRVLQELYGAPGAEVPRRVLVPVLPESPEVLTAWLSGAAGRAGAPGRAPAR